MATLPLPPASRACLQDGEITKSVSAVLSVPRRWSSHATGEFLRFAKVDGGGCCQHTTCLASRSWIEKLRPRSEVRTGTKEVNCYRFRTDDDGTVKVLVRPNKNGGYSVQIEVSYLPQNRIIDGLELNGGMYRSDSPQLFVPGPQTEPADSNEGAGLMKAQLVPNSLGVHTAELEFDSSQVPFYLSFVLRTTGSDIRTHRNTNFRVPVGFGRGQPMPLGVSFMDDGMVNFSLFSRNAEGVILCLYDMSKSEPAMEIELDPYINRTGHLWHVSLENIEGYASYGYRCKGPIQWSKGGRFHMRHVLLDPYSKLIGDFVPDQGEKVSFAKCLASLETVPSFDWGSDARLCLPLETLVVYRLNAGLFTKDKSSGLPENVAGTFSGIAGKVQHFKALGVNAILLEPIFPFDELKGSYFPYHFFSPVNAYGHGRDGFSAINCLKEMIKALHANGIEVLLEVVFAHTSEGGDATCQMISFRGIDNSSYYIVGGEIGSGTNNSLNCNNPVVQRLILDSMRYWVLEFHVDGFCFINSSYLTRDVSGHNLSRPPLVEAIAFDPLLSKTKIITDPWSPVDLSNVDIRFPHWKRWAEMNPRFCSDIRNFLRGKALLSDLATRLCGSGDLFSSRGPSFSFNYITKNFGLPLVDLVSFSSGELASELSWNCGEEGPTDDSSVLETRLKQIRNFLFILFISLGVPVLNMGDECGFSTGGSASYNDRQPMNWNSLRTSFGQEITQFIAYLTSLRNRRSDIFQRKDFLKVENINWLGSNQSEPRWADPACKFISMALKAEIDDEGSDPDRGDLFITFNAGNGPESIALPYQPEGTFWVGLVDTSLAFPGFFADESDPNVRRAAGSSSYQLKAHSCALFEARKEY